MKNNIPRCMALLVVSFAINEFMGQYFSSRYILLVWAVLCLWILLDASLVAASLTQAELALKEQAKRNEALHAENMLQAMQMTQITDNHLMLCEIRTRLIHHTQKHKQAGVQNASISRSASVETCAELIVMEQAPNRAFSANTDMVGLFGFKQELLQRSLKVMYGPLTDMRAFMELQKRGFYGHESESGSFTFYKMNGDTIPCQARVISTIVNNNRAIRISIVPSA